MRSLQHFSCALDGGSDLSLCPFRPIFGHCVSCEPCRAPSQSSSSALHTLPLSPPLPNHNEALLPTPKDSLFPRENASRLGLGRVPIVSLIVRSTSRNLHRTLRPLYTAPPNDAVRVRLLHHHVVSHAGRMSLCTDQLTSIAVAHCLLLPRRDTLKASLLLLPTPRTASPGQRTPSLTCRLARVCWLSQSASSHFSVVLRAECPGTYQLSDQIQLGTIPLHPTEVPQQATHVLDPRPVPITSGVKLSLAVIALRKTSPRIRTLPTAGSARSSSSSNAIGTGTPGTTLSGSDSGAAGHTGSSNNPLSLRWRFGENQAFNGTAKEPKDPAKRRKPGKGIIKSNSSFISRVIQQEQVLKTLGQRDPAGLFVFLNTSRAFQWLDLASAERMVRLSAHSHSRRASEADELAARAPC